MRNEHQNKRFRQCKKIDLIYPVFNFNTFHHIAIRNLLLHLPLATCYILLYSIDTYKYCYMELHHEWILKFEQENIKIKQKIES